MWCLWRNLHPEGYRKLSLQTPWTWTNAMVTLINILLPLDWPKCIAELTLTGSWWMPFNEGWPTNLLSWWPLPPSWKNKKRLAGNGYNGSTRQESSTKTWYNSKSSEAGETATSYQLKQLEPLDLPGIPMPWTLTESISPPETGLSTCKTTSASSVTKRDVTSPNTRDTPEEEENSHNKEHNPHGGLPKLGKLKEIPRSTTSWNSIASLWSNP